MKLTDAEEEQLRRGRGGGGGWWRYFSLPEVKDGNDTEREVSPLLSRMIQKEKCFLCYIDDVTCWILSPFIFCMAGDRQI